MLIPMSIGSAKGLILPIVYALATGIPVIIIAWLLAFTISGFGRFYNALKQVEVWMRRIIAVVFIGVGVYYLWVIWIKGMLF
jgi:threonine/homoserine/homoserine lactone efflux protein